MSDRHVSRRPHGSRSLVAVLAVLAAVAVASLVHARGPIGRPGSSAHECEEARCRVDGALAEACPCESAASRKEYVRCVTLAANGLALLAQLPKKCRKAAVRCARKSTCGRFDRVACRLTLRNGATRCTVKPAERCRGVVTAGTCCPPCATATTTTTSTTSPSPADTTTTSLPPGVTTTTTTTTTTSTTTTTLIPCAGLYPVCLGPCPAGMVCSGNMLLGGCFCTP
jgi:hypothetical protein